MSTFKPVYRFPFDLRIVQAAAEGGEAYAQWRLGNCYAAGQDVEVDLDKAAHWYAAAAAQGNELGHRAIAFMHAHGQLGPVNPEKALAHYLEAAKGGMTRASFEAGYRLLYGIGAPRDVERGIGFLRSAAANGDERALAYVAYFDAFGVAMQESLGDAARRAFRAAISGNVDAHFALATFHLAGIGYAASRKTAIGCLKDLGHRGRPQARRLLGRLIWEEAETADSPLAAEAHRWMMIAAQEGDAPAMTAVGEYYAYGVGVAQDPFAAKAWLMRAYEAGDAAGAGALGRHLLSMSEGTKEDVLLAAKLLEEGAARGHYDARQGLATLARCFVVTLADHPSRERWLADGLLFGSGDATAVLGELLLSSDEVRGLFWLQTGAEEGSTMAMKDLAGAYFDRGRQTEALALLESAAFLGDMKAAAQLAFHFNFHPKILRNMTHGARINEFAAKNGDPVAMHNLALQLKNGEGIEQDRVASDYWFRKQEDAEMAARYAEGEGTSVSPPEPLQQKPLEGKVLDLSARRAKGDQSA